MNKKTTIILIVIIIAILIAGSIWFYLQTQRKSLKNDLSDIEIPEIEMPYQTNIPDLELQTFDFEVDFPGDLFSNVESDN